MKVRTATLEDKPEVTRIAKQSKFTKGALHIWFLSDEAYNKGQVAVAVERKRIKGFVLVNNLKRKPYTSLHYVGVDENNRSKGVGAELVRWAMGQSPWGHIRLISELENPRSHAFYERMGFHNTGTGENRSGEPYYVFEAWADELK